MCVKTLSQQDNQKIFVNICQSTLVPPPPELSREELVDLLQSEDPTGYRVPMSLGEPHTEMDNDWKILKNRKFFGSVSEQNIRTKSRPVIQELQPMDTSNTPTTVRPEFSLLVEPSAGDPEFLIAEIQLPGVRSSRALVLDVGEDRLILTGRPGLFHLDLFHPLVVDQGGSVAQYNTHTQILTVTMPVVSS
ncbi:hypothetical protein NHX12_016324 [Muraenolepis orangiensis]|uniref:PIH1 domain-containing protein 1 n=1 Tax=Muraenolepis orangiensis TaxID=630683 RepID=A0A9Q0D848_9TELE|nr:hypothetical protein NHX12_016324 [Muraenolepis orangiensis]